MSWASFMPRMFFHCSSELLDRGNVKKAPMQVPFFLLILFAMPSRQMSDQETQSLHHQVVYL